MLISLWKSCLQAAAFSLTASQAFAICGENLEVSFSDGSVACVWSFETKSQLIVEPVAGSEKPTKRLRTTEWVHTVLNFPNEASAGAFRDAKLSARAEEACSRLRSELLQKLQNPSDTILEVVMTWGERPQKPVLGNAPDYRAFALDRDCKASAQQ